MVESNSGDPDAASDNQQNSSSTDTENQKHQPLPATKFCNRISNPNPVQGDGPLGNESAGKMSYNGANKSEYVTTVQEMLIALGYSVGSTKGDGKFGKNTQNAVEKFQKEHKDWEGKDLRVDGLVGPLTSDTLNRYLVGRWFDHYQTLDEQTKNIPVHTVTADFIKKGLSIEPKSAKKGFIFIVGKAAKEGELSLRFMNETWAPIAKLRCTYNGQEETTDESGRIAGKSIGKDDTLKATFDDTPTFDQSRYNEDLQKSISSLTGLKIVLNKNDGGEGPIRKGDGRKEHVKSVQQMLNALDFYLGETGEDKDGVDGDFGKKTKNAVLSFQSLSVSDKKGEPLAVDGLVGPETIRSLACECVREGIIKYYISIETKEDQKELVYTANRGVLQESGVDMKALFEFKETAEKKMGGKYNTIVVRPIDRIPSSPLTFEENGEPAKWLFVYMSKEDDSPFLKHSFVTNEDGILQSWEDGEPSRVLERNNQYSLFYDWRPWSEDKRKELKKDDCQTVTLDQEIKLQPKKGDVNLKLQLVDGTPLKNRPYILHLPGGGTEDGDSGESGEIQKTDVQAGIIRLEMAASKVGRADSGQDSSYGETGQDASGTSDGITGEDTGGSGETGEATEEVLRQFEAFEKKMMACEVTPYEEKEIPELTDDSFLVDISVLQAGNVIACRGKECSIRVFYGWRAQPYGYFYHWQLSSPGVNEDPEDDLMVFQNPKRRVINPKKEKEGE